MTRWYAFRAPPAILAIVILATAFAVACGDSSDDRGQEASDVADTTTGETSADGDALSRGNADRASQARAQDGAPDRKPGRDADSASPRDPGAAADDGGGERQVERVVKAMYRDFAAGDASGVCSTMSRQARREIARRMPLSGGDTSPGANCEDSFRKFVEAAASSGILQRSLAVAVGDVRIDGGTATAEVTIDGVGGRIALVQEGGSWRFDRPPGAGPGVRR